MLLSEVPCRFYFQGTAETSGWRMIIRAGACRLLAGSGETVGDSALPRHALLCKSSLRIMDVGAADSDR